MDQDEYYDENEIMMIIDNSEWEYRQKMDLLRNKKTFLEEADVREFIMNLWATPPKRTLNWRYIWWEWLEEQKEIASNGW